MSKREKEQSEPEMYWVALFIGACFAIWGAEQIVAGEPIYFKGIEAPSWTGFVTLPFGLWIVFVSIRGLWRNRVKPPKPKQSPAEIDEEIARAKAKLDVLYGRKPNEQSETPKKDT